MKYLIIPGIGGSKLYCDCFAKRKQIYPKPLARLAFNLDSHFFQPCQVYTEPLLRVYGMSVYDKLVQRLGPENVTVLSYDWRQDPITIAKLIVPQLIRGATLIGHSNGGIILRVIFEYLGIDRTNYGPIVLCGTPFYGTMYENQYNDEEYVYQRLWGNASAKRIKTRMFTKNDHSKMFTTFPNVLIYYIPTWRFQDFKIPPSVCNVEFTKARILHQKFSHFECRDYIIYFNTNYTIKVPHVNVGVANAINSKISTKKGRVVLSRKLASDSMIIPATFMVPGSTTIHDNVNLKHSLMMNSKFLADFIKGLGRRKG